jgi:hypothetical protein
MVQWEDPFDGDDEDEQPEPWQEVAWPVDAPHVPAAYGSCEPSAYELLERCGARTGRSDYAAHGRGLRALIRSRVSR